MTYSQTIEYLFNTLPMYSRMGAAAYKKDLTNITQLCAKLGNPQQKFKTVHVGGTNGKGSVSHMLAAILQTAGYKTGLHTSPHLHDFRERIKIDGAMIPEDFVVDFVSSLKPHIEAIEPSFFEITVAMAFAYFAAQKVDIAIIEVGLGGRLDSTNIILPELSVITNIGFDHMNILGHTMKAIATEKAGIIKQNMPIVIGEKAWETEKVFASIATEKKAPLYFAPDLFSVTHYALQPDYITITVQNKVTGLEQTYQLDLPGIYQTKNLLTVLQSVTVLKTKGYNLNDDLVMLALTQIKKRTGLHGRWEVIGLQPTTVLEVAHNEDGIRQMLTHIKEIKYSRLHLVLGMVKDKEVDHVLRLLPENATFYFTHAHIPRALPAATLQQNAATYGLQGKVYDDVNKAAAAAQKNAATDDLIIICGSIFLVAEVVAIEKSESQRS